VGTNLSAIEKKITQGWAWKQCALFGANCRPAAYKAAVAVKYDMADAIRDYPRSESKSCKVILLHQVHWHTSSVVVTWRMAFY